MRDLELEARGRRQRGNRNNRERRDDSMGNQGEEGSSQFGPRRFRDRSLSRESHRYRNHLRSRKTHQHQNRSRSHGYDDHGSDSPEERRTYNAAMDAMSRALQRAAQSPFSN